MTLTRNSLQALLLLTLGCLVAFGQTAVPAITYAYNGPPQTISYTTGSVATFVTIQVPSLVSITKLTVTVNISYPVVSDLNLYLFGPDGIRTKLLERNCSGMSATLVNMTFDDSASTMYNSFCPAEAGRGPFKGNEPLSNYNNKVASGTWTLGIQNTVSPANTGVINGFSLSIAGNAPPTPTISANAIFNSITAQTGPIAPGEILSVVGANIGPAVAVSASAGNLPTTLGGVQLLINGMPVPLFYASSTLVNAILPYTAGSSGAVIGGTVTLQIGYNGATSNSVTTGVAMASPGLFTVSRTDANKTQVKAINPDGTLN
ncbi:MAG TPA: proprotein convertase P-domain-containing protein [Bryobacteraceae bacterium]|nr:proprotein convertase P-domain-containing protein [Bryobacteraceae bacterium]